VPPKVAINYHKAVVAKTGHEARAVVHEIFYGSRHGARSRHYR
jgi:hypothetical protein